MFFFLVRLIRNQTKYDENYIAGQTIFKGHSLPIVFFTGKDVERKGRLGNAEEELGVSVWQGAETLPMMNPHRDPSLHKEPLRLYELHCAVRWITTNQCAGTIKSAEYFAER